MRLFVSVIASLAMFFVASTASAVLNWTTSTSVASGNPLSALVPGDVVTIDITLRSDGEATQGVGGAASGYDPSVASFTSGQAANDILVQVCVPSAGCFNGFDNLQDGALAEDNSNPAGPFVQFLTGVVLGTPNTNTGALDEGLAGVTGSPQFQVVFTAQDAGSTAITLGADPVYGNALILPGGGTGVSNNSIVNLTVIPEPGTALLMGLGLAGLAAAGRRE